MAFGHLIPGESELMGTHEIEGLGEFGPEDCAGAAKFLEGHFEEVLEAGDIKDPDVIEGLLYLGAIERFVHDFPNEGYEQYLPVFYAWQEQARESVADGKEPWHPLESPDLVPRGLQVLSGVVEGSDGEYYAVPPHVRYAALADLAAVLGGLTPTCSGHTGELKYDVYLPVIPDKRQLAEAKFDPDQTPELPVHDRKLSDHAMAVVEPPVLTDLTMADVSWVLRLAENDDARLARDICMRVDSLTRRVGNIAFNTILEYLEPWAFEAEVSKMISLWGWSFGRTTDWPPSELVGVVNDQFVLNIDHLRDAERDLNSLPELHVEAWARHFESTDSDELLLAS